MYFTSLASLRKLVLCSLDGKLDGKVIGYKGGQALFAQSRNRSCTASKASNHPFWCAQCLRSRVHNETSWKLLGADQKVLTEREKNWKNISVRRFAPLHKGCAHCNTGRTACSTQKR